MKTGILVCGFGMALAVYCWAAELRLAARGLRGFDVEWSTNLVEWNWFGTWIETNRGEPLAGITVDASTTNQGVVYAWRVAPSSNVWTTAVAGTAPSSAKPMEGRPR